MDDAADERQGSPSVHVEVVLRCLDGVSIVTPATRTDSTGYGRGGRRDLVVVVTSLGPAVVITSSATE